MTHCALLDCINTRPDEAPQFIWGWLAVHSESDLIAVTACGQTEVTQICGTRAVNLGKLMLRAMWRKHLGLDAIG